jgi:hypothetical protein
MAQYRIPTSEIVEIVENLIMIGTTVGQNLEENVYVNDNPTWKTFNRVTVEEENAWHFGKRTAPWSSSLFIVN